MRRFRADIQAELDRAAVYRAMAEVERDAGVARSFHRLAEAEQRHAGFWRDRLAEMGASASLRPSARARLLARLARRFGSRLVLPAAVSLEQAEQETYERRPRRPTGPTSPTMSAYMRASLMQR